MSSEALKVIHCFRSPVGGLFRHVCDLINQQARQGMQVGIICDSSTGGDQAVKSLSRLEKSCALGIHRLPMSRSLNFSDIKVLKAFSQIYKETSLDIIHTHGGKGGAYGRLLAKKLGSKAIYTPHGGSLHYNFSTPVGFIYLFLEKILKPLTNGLIFESQYSADTYKKKIGGINGPQQVIYNGLRDNEFISVDNSKATSDFVFVGEIRKLKGIEVLLLAIARVSEHHKINTLIIGAGPDEDFFKERAVKLGIEDRVKFLPPIFPASKAFSQARCIIIPSLAESFPYIVLEVVAAKIPILTTQVGGIPEIFGSHKEHLVMPNDPEALAKAMQKMIQEPQLAQQLAEQLQGRVKLNFRSDQMVKHTIEFYQRVLNYVG